MNKVQIRWIALCAPLIILFNVLFFLLGGSQPVASIWISYAFIHIAFVLMVAAPFISSKGKSGHLYRETTILISSVYFLIQFAVGVLLILFKPDPWTLPLAIQLVLLAVSFMALMFNQFANIRSASIEDRNKETQKVFKSAMNALTQAAIDAEEKDKGYINTILTDLRTSPLTASESLTGLENNILSESIAMQQAAAEGDSNGIHMHGAVLSQLILLRKQNPV